MSIKPKLSIHINFYLEEFEIHFEYKASIKNKFSSIEDVLDKRFAYRLKYTERKLESDPKSLYIFKIENPIRKF